MINESHFRILALVALISACAAPSPVARIDDLPHDQIRAMDEIEIYSHTKTIKRKFDVLKTIDGISCKNSIWGFTPSMREAILQARYGAQQIGADAIVDFRCDRPPNPADTYDCSEIVICTGNAVNFR